MAPRLAIAAVAAVVVVSVLAILHSTDTGPSPGPLRTASAARHLAEAATTSAYDAAGDELAEDLARFSAQVEGTVGAPLEAEDRDDKHKRKRAKRKGAKRTRKHMSKREKRATRHKHRRRRWWLDSPGFRTVQEACKAEAHLFCPAAERFFEFKAPQPAASLARSWSRDNPKPKAGRDGRHSPATVALASPMEAVQCLQMFTAELGDACRAVLAQLPTAQDDTLRALRLCYDDPPATCVPDALSGSGDGAPATAADGNDATIASGSEAGDASDAHTGSGVGSSDGSTVEEPAPVAARDGAGAAASERRVLRSKSHAPVLAPDADVVAHTAPADLLATPEVEAERDVAAPQANDHGDGAGEAAQPTTRSDKAGRKGKKRRHKKRGKHSKKDSGDGDDAVVGDEAHGDGEVATSDAAAASDDVKHREVDAASDGIRNDADDHGQRQHKGKSGKRRKNTKKRRKEKSKQKKLKKQKKHRGDDEDRAGKTKKKKRRSKTRKPLSLYQFLKCLRYNRDDLQGRCSDAWTALPASYYDDWRDSYHGMQRALVPSEDSGADADGEAPNGPQRRLSTRRQRLHHRRSLPTHYTVTLLAGGVVGILLAATVAVVLIRRRNAARSRQAAAS